MKKSLQILALLFIYLINAQAPEKFSYQADIKNASNVLIPNTPIGIKISILKNSATGTVVYAETQNVVTNSNGLVSLQIGAGTVVSGTIAGINWSNDSYYIKTETDVAGGTNYSIAGTSQLLSVPYAMFAKSSGGGTSIPENWTKTGNNIANNNTGNVGIGTGTTAPSSLLTVKKDGIGFAQENLSGTTQVGFYTYGVDAYIQTHSNNDLQFATNNETTQMTLQKATGNVGIGDAAPTEKLVVAGKTKTTDLQVSNGAAVGKVLTSDVGGNATWQTPTTVNQFYETNAYNLSTTIQGAAVDFATTNVVVPVTGTYLITYYLNGYNTWSCSQCAVTNGPYVYNTSADLYNKTTNQRYQYQAIDFLFTDRDLNGVGSFDNSKLPAHQISGSIVKTLNANEVVGFKMRSNADAGVTGEIRINECNVTLVKLNYIKNKKKIKL